MYNQLIKVALVLSRTTLKQAITRITASHSCEALINVAHLPTKHFSTNCAFTCVFSLALVLSTLISERPRPSHNQAKPPQPDHSKTPEVFSCSAGCTLWPPHESNNLKYALFFSCHFLSMANPSETSPILRQRRLNFPLSHQTGIFCKHRSRLFKLLPFFKRPARLVLSF